MERIASEMAAVRNSMFKKFKVRKVPLQSVKDEARHLALFCKFKRFLWVSAGLPFKGSVSQCIPTEYLTSEIKD